VADEIYIFSDLAQSEAEILAQHSQTRSYAAGTILFSEGDRGDAMYVIKEGDVKVFAGDENGKEVILQFLHAGDYFGEMALIDDAPRSASVMTMTPVKVMVVSKSAFMKFLASNEEIAFNLVRSLIRKVRSLTNNVKSLALLDVYGRVAHTLLDLASDVDGKTVITEKPTHQEFANIVGSSREMVSRILKDLSNGGYITVDKNTITINEKLPPAW